MVVPTRLPQYLRPQFSSSRTYPSSYPNRPAPIVQEVYNYLDLASNSIRGDGRPQRRKREHDPFEQLAEKLLPGEDEDD